MILTDVLSSTLGALRISGSLVLHHAYAAPWAVDIPSSDALAQLTGAGPDARVVAFHFVERGELELDVAGERVTVGSGELVACFGGSPHRMMRGRGANAVPLADVLSGHASPPSGNDQPQSTRLLCGVFVLRDTALNPLLGALPTLVHARVLDDHLELITRVLQRELREPGNASAFIINRTLETLCAGLVRQHLERTQSDAVGLFRALKEPGLCRALEQVHRDPSASWSVESLAKRAGLSRSRFSARFSELAGEPPMVYVTRWRMNVAARLLRSSELTVAEVASRVGYESVPSFSRVFKRSLGTPPARYRNNAPPASTVRSGSDESARRVS